jgi:hypothetical protein
MASEEKESVSQLDSIIKNTEEDKFKESLERSRSASSKVTEIKEERRIRRNEYERKRRYEHKVNPIFEVTLDKKTYKISANDIRKCLEDLDELFLKLIKIHPYLYVGMKHLSELSKRFVLVTLIAQSTLER